MNRIQLFTDGSGVRRKISNNKVLHFIAWGIVAIHDDQTTEIHDVLEVKTSQVGCNHEIAAMIIAIKYAVDNGYLLENISLFSDCEEVAFCPGRFHEHNYYNTEWRKDFVNRIKATLEVLNIDPAFFDIVMLSFSKSRYVKVRGHSRCVYNNRADYLARKAVHRDVDEKIVDLLSFETWLMAGISYWISNEEQKTWFAPFTVDLLEVQQ